MLFACVLDALLASALLQHRFGSFLESIGCLSSRRRNTQVHHSSLPPRMGARPCHVPLLRLLQQILFQPRVYRACHFSFCSVDDLRQLVVRRDARHEQSNRELPTQQNFHPDRNVSVFGARVASRTEASRNHFLNMAQPLPFTQLCGHQQTNCCTKCQT